MGFMDNMRDALIANLRHMGDANAARQEFNSIRRERKYEEYATFLPLGRAVLRLANGQTIVRWSKEGRSHHYATGREQLDYYEGYVGEKNQRMKVHIAVDAEDGRLLFVRDIDGRILFDRSKGDTPPPGWL